MFAKLIRAIPAPMLIGLIVSLIAVFIGWLFSVSATVVFATLVFFAWLFLCFGEYKLPASNHVMILLYVLLGHAPYLVVKFLL